MFLCFTRCGRTPETRNARDFQDLRTALISGREHMEAWTKETQVGATSGHERGWGQFMVVSLLAGESCLQPQRSSNKSRVVKSEKSSHLLYPSPPSSPASTRQQCLIPWALSPGSPLIHPEWWIYSIICYNCILTSARIQVRQGRHLLQAQCLWRCPQTPSSK